MRIVLFCFVRVLLKHKTTKQQNKDNITEISKQENSENHCEYENWKTV